MKTIANSALEALGSELYKYVQSTGVMTEEPDLGFDSYNQWYGGDKSFRDYAIEIVEYRLGLVGKFVPEMYGADTEYPIENDSNEQGEP